MLVFAECADRYYPFVSVQGTGDPATRILRWWNSILFNDIRFSIQAGAGRFGRTAFSFPRGGNNAGTLCGMRKVLPTTSKITVGFPMKLQGTINTGLNAQGIFRVLDGVNLQCDLRVREIDGFAVFTRNGTQLNTPVATGINAASEVYVEIQVVVNTVSGSCVLKVNGATIINLTGVNNANAGTNQYTAFDIGTGEQNCPSWWMTDLYVTNGLGSMNTDFLGDVSVPLLVPQGNGTYTAWTNNTSARPASTTLQLGYTILDSNANLQRVVTSGTTAAGGGPTWNLTVGGTTTDGGVTWMNLGPVAAYKLVNEPVEDDDASYLSTTGVGNKATFTYPAQTGNTIKGVIQAISARKDDTGGRSVRGLIRSAGADYDSGTDVPLNTGYVDIPQIWETDPATGLAWTVSGLNAAEFGVKLTA